MPSLRELQLRFAHSVTAPRPPVDPRLDIYRHNIASNLRNALAATYRVTRMLVGGIFFDAAADAFAVVSPPNCGDLNVYGGKFGAFLEGYAPAASLAYLPDIARLEWALDEAARAGDADGTAREVLAAVARRIAGGDDVSLGLHPSCRLLCSAHPVMRIWQAHQEPVPGSIDLDAGGERLLVRREGARPCIERVSRAEHAWLDALARGATLDAATALALREDGAFDLAAALRTRIADGTIAAVA